MGASAELPTIRALQAMEGNKTNTRYFLRQTICTSEKMKLGGMAQVPYQPKQKQEMTAYLNAHLR